MATYTITPVLSSKPLDANNPGNGMCLFFWNAEQEFFPGGIGSGLGYCNVLSAAAHNVSSAAGGEAHMNGVPGGYLGVGFDLVGDFSSSKGGKSGEIFQARAKTLEGSGKQCLSGATRSKISPNTICVRMSEASGYRVHSVSPNLSTFPVALESSHGNIHQEKYLECTPVHLHQQVASRDNVQFQSVKVTLQNKGRRIKVEIKDKETGDYHPYHVADITDQNGNLVSLDDIPSRLKLGLGFTTGNQVTNCEIQNFNIYGNLATYSKDMATTTPPLSTNIVNKYF